MIVGIPKEIKEDEYRVAMLPAGVESLKRDGHRVLLERGAGASSGYPDDAYVAAGAELVESGREVYGQAELVVKVKEPLADEIDCFRPGLLVFCYFHFAGSRDLTTACLEKKITALAYETLSDSQNRRPLLTPMSEVAGRMSIQEGAKCLENPMRGRGVLLGGVSGVESGKVLILGGGVVGANAARVAAGIGAQVTILDIDLERLRVLNETMPPNVSSLYCDAHAVERHAVEADLVIGAVLVPGGRAPVLADRSLLKRMKERSVFVDVSIDQGGCWETSRPTSHRDPVYIVDEVIHYCVTNIPGAVGRTSSQALCNATFPYCRELANGGLEPFLERSPGRAAALAMRDGQLHGSALIDEFPDLR